MNRRPTPIHVPTRTKLLIAFAFVTVGLVGLWFGSPTQRYRESEEVSCTKTCSVQHKAGRLVSSYAPGMVAPGKYDGPWQCECY